MKCCSNCEWSISSELEDEIMEEQGYKEDDPNRPHAGDCSIGMEHDENYYCQYHQNLQEMEEYENFILYDDKYLGSGYFIITKLDDEIIKFVKISSFGEGGFPYYRVRGFEKYSIDNPDEKFRKINITAKNNEPLYELISLLAKNLNNKSIYSVDPISQGKNNLKAKYNMNEATLTLEKDVYGVKHATNFIDILLGDNDSCENYNAITNFYIGLSTLSMGRTKENDIKKLLLTK